ncbi:MAG: site-specific integrase [Solirubrobacteraceae bacterium]|nr:site-specific integrase [Solirubrobacteraceae bacterium]
MPRAATCQIIRRATKRGTSYFLRVRYDGERVLVRLGGSWEGWDEERVETERALTAQLLARGEWRPPDDQRRAQAAARSRRAARSQTFHRVASDYYAAQEPRLKSDKSKTDLKWRLSVASTYLGEFAIDEINEGHIDDMVTALLKERDEIERAAAGGEPLKETYVDSRTGREHERRRRGLSNDSINKIVAGTARVLEDQRRRGVIDRVPVDRTSRVKSAAPSRSFLEVFQMQAVRRAATALEVEARGLTWDDVKAIRRSRKSAVALAKEYRVSDVLIGKIRRREIWTEQPKRRRNDVPRVAPIGLLLLSGVRISEGCGLEFARHIDFPAGLIRITRDITKSDAGVRAIPMLPRVRDDLLALKADRGGRYVLETRDGNPQRPDNVRANLIDKVVELSNEMLAAAGQRPIEHCTPHSLRRTFASIMAEVGVPPRRAMTLMGHTDARFTMSVYQQVLDMGAEEWRALPDVLGCTPQEALGILTGRSVGASAARGLGNEWATEPANADADAK